MRLIENKLNEKITLSLEGKLILFNSNEIIIIAGHKQSTRFFIENKDILTSSYHLGHFKNLIERCRLEKVHRSYFINTDKIQMYEIADETILMSNNERVPLGRFYKKEFLKRIGFYPDIKK